MSQPSDTQLSRGAFHPGVAAVLLALLAPALGGGTGPLAMALLLAGVGAAALALPARSVPRGYFLGAGLVFAGTLAWALPAGMAPAPWRAQLTAAGLPQAWTASPEPWISLRAWLCLLGGLTWAGWCAGLRWSDRSRTAACEGLAAGVGLIALVALAARHGRVPGWPAGTGLGPFANRNQTATLFAMGAFLSVACGVGRLRRLSAAGAGAGRLLAWGGAWLCLLAVYTAALALDRSRAGPLLFAGMTLAWACMAAPQGKLRAGTLAAGLALALLLGALFLLTGRTVIARLAAGGVNDFRLKIFSDALQMIRAAPWTGTGLGCFEPIFPLYRQASILQERVLHPESDWLWLAAETGVPGVLAIAGMLAWMGSRAWRGLARPDERATRLAPCVACLGFLAHGLVDVPAHRLGTIMPALLLLGMAAGGGESGVRWKTRLLQGMGLAVMLLGAAGAAALAWGIPTPLAGGAALLSAQAASLARDGKPDAAEAALGKAMEWEPLDWPLYAARAQLEGRRGQWTEALEDFRRARFLEPDYAGLPFDEGIFWLGVAPRFAIAPWREALRRMPWKGRAELYQNMMAHAYPGQPGLRPALWSMAAGDARMDLAALGWAAPVEFTGELSGLLAGDPELKQFNQDQLQALFKLWMSKGDPKQLAPLLASHPVWMQAGYRVLAEHEAATGDTTAALALMLRFLSAPRVPPTPAISHDEAAQRFAQDAGDIAAGMALYADAIAAGRTVEALETLRGMSGQPDCPPYVHYLEALALAKNGDTTGAWTALQSAAP